MIVPPRMKRQQQAELARAEEARLTPPPPPPRAPILREPYTTSGGWMVPLDNSSYLFVKEPTSIWYCSQCGVYVDDSKSFIHHPGHTGHKFQPKRSWFELRRPKAKFLKPPSVYDIIWVLPQGAEDPKSGGRAI